MMFLCVNIYWYIVTCTVMVITCQTPEFGRATTVLGITMLGKFLQIKQRVDNTSLNKEIHCHTLIGNARLG